MTVAPAAPATPQWSTSTKTRSRTTFKTAAIPRNSKGTKELPTERSSEAKKL